MINSSRGTGDVAVYKVDRKTGEHTFVFDFAALERLDADAYQRGFADGKRKAENASGTTEKLAQIERMARQVEECHTSLRRRNATIAQLERRIRQLEADVLKVKAQTEGEARAEAWHEGWLHDSNYAFTFGQRCPSADCNPYLAGKGEK